MRISDWSSDVCSSDLSAQAAEIFNELSSAEIYGSLAAVDQNAVFNTTVNRLAARRSYGEALGTQLWFNPSANFAKTGGTKSGASKIKTNSYGGAFGIDVAYQEDCAFGLGFCYGQHELTHQIGHGAGRKCVCQFV